MKKLTYLVASLLTTATVGMTFTGCIDNDEPYGIEQLRGAKAELLKSKKALVEADAQYKLALAEAAKVEAAAKAALIDAERAKTEAEIAEIRQRMEAAALQAEQILAKLQAEAELARLKYEQEKLTLSEQQQTALDKYYENYFEALQDYNTKYIAYVRAQKLLVQNALDTDGNKYMEKKNAEDAVTTAQEDLADAQDLIVKLKAELENVKGWSATEIGERYTKYADQVKKNNETLKQLDLKIAENTHESAEGQALVAAQKAVEALQKEEIAIPAYTFNADGTITIPGLDEPEVVIGDGWSYTYENPGARHGYNEAVNKLFDFEMNLRRYVLDDNDAEWTKARINELKGQKETMTSDFDKVFEGWQMYAKAYNLGAAPKYDAITGYDELKKAVDAYNAQVPATQAAREAYYAAKAELEENIPAALADAEKVKDDAINAAYKAYRNAIVAAAADFNKTVAPLQTAYDNASANYGEADYKAYQAELLAQEADAADSPDKDALKEAATEARKAADALKVTMEAAETALNEGQEAAKLKRERAEHAADVEYSAANQKAWATYNSIYNQYNEEYGVTNAMSVAKAKFDLAQETYNSEKYKLSLLIKDWNDDEKGIFGAVNAQIENAKIDIVEYYYNGTSSYTWIPSNDNTNPFWKFNSKVNVLLFNDDNSEEAIPVCSVADVCAFQPIQIKENILYLSHIAYGYSYYDDQNDDQVLGIPCEQLIPLTKEDIDKMLAKYNIKEIYYPNFYQNFGIFGRTLYVDNRIEVATNYLDNKASVEAAFNEIKTQIENLDASYEEMEEKIEEANEAVLDALEAVNKLNAGVDAEAKELRRQNEVANAMMTAILDAADLGKDVADDEDLSGVLNFNDLSLEDIIKHIEKVIKEKEEGIPALEEALAKAEYLLDQAEKGESIQAELDALKVEKAKLAMDAAKEKLDAAKARLDAAIKSVEGAE